MKYLNTLDTARLDKFFDHTGISESPEFMPGLCEGTAAARFPETDLKQFLWETGLGGRRRKPFIELVGRTGIESVAR